MNWNDCEYSKYDSIVEEAVNKIKAEIEADIKGEIEDQLLWEERYDSACDTIKKYQRENDSLRNEIDILNNKLEQKQEHKYNIDNIVYFLASDNSISHTYVCPTCQGTGFANLKELGIEVPEGIDDLKVKCPVCHGASYTTGGTFLVKHTYYPHYVAEGKIVGIYKDTSGIPCYKYRVKNLRTNTYEDISECLLYNTKESAKKLLDSYLTEKEEVAKYIGPDKRLPEYQNKNDKESK